jgi:hypothetical protein
MEISWLQRRVVTSSRASKPESWIELGFDDERLAICNQRNMHGYWVVDWTLCKF